MLEEGFIDKIYFRFHRVENSKGLIFAVHGLGGHSIWFDEAAKIFNKNQYSLFSFDLPGFGQSKFEIGKINSYKNWIDTTEEIYKKLFTDFNVKEPVFILGHSMGAIVSSFLVEKLKPSGFILSVPGFQGNKNIFPKKFILSTVLKSFFKPNDPIFLPFGPEMLVRSPQIQRSMKEDKFRVIAPTASLLKEVNFMTRASYKYAINISLPVFFIYAELDKVCSNEAMEVVYENLRSKRKSIKKYIGFYHDLFAEEDVYIVVEDICKWMNEINNKL